MQPAKGRLLIGFSIFITPLLNCFLKIFVLWEEPFVHLSPPLLNSLEKEFLDVESGENFYDIKEVPSRFGERSRLQKKG